MMKHTGNIKEHFKPSIVAKNNTTIKYGLEHIWTVECYDKNGNLKWKDTFKNKVVNEGLNDVLDKYWKGTNYNAQHYVGLISGTPTVNATDTLASHPGWTEIVDYVETTRQPLTLGTVSAQSVDNSGSKAVFNINSTTTIGGAMITTDSTKGGTTGLLIAAGAFSTGDRALISGDILNLQITFNAASL